MQLTGAALNRQCWYSSSKLDISNRLDRMVVELTLLIDYDELPVKYSTMLPPYVGSVLDVASNPAESQTSMQDACQPGEKEWRQRKRPRRWRKERWL